MNTVLAITISFILTNCKQVERTIETNSLESKVGSEKVKLDTSRVAVVPYDSTYRWIFDDATPTPTRLDEEDFVEIEKMLSSCLEEYNSEARQEYNEMNKEHPEYNLKIENFVIDLDQYKRQYVPVINDSGEKIVWVNCFCDDSNANWKEDLVFVLDGGNCYFSVYLNLTKAKYYDLIVNGDA